MDLILFGEIFEGVVYKFLSIIDFYHYSLTCKSCSILYNKLDKEKILHDIIDKKLRCFFGNNLEEFYETLEQADGVISGSFVLQCILDVEWDGDLDVYIPEMMPGDPNVVIVKNFMNKMDPYIQFSKIGYDCLDFLLMTTQDYLFFEKSPNIENRQRLMELKTKFDPKSNKFLSYQNIVMIDNKIFVDDLYEYKLNKIQIVSVIVKENELINTINKIFDFDIGKNYITRCDGVNKIKIYKFSDIAQKITPFKSTSDRLGSLQRKTKYEKRGFTFI